MECSGVQGFWGVANLLILERETGLEPATSGLGSWHQRPTLTWRAADLADSNRPSQSSTRSNRRPVHSFPCLSLGLGYRFECDSRLRRRVQRLRGCSRRPSATRHSTAQSNDLCTRLVHGWVIGHPKRLKLKNWLPGMDSNHDSPKQRRICKFQSFQWSKMPDWTRRTDTRTQLVHGDCAR